MPVVLNQFPRTSRRTLQSDTLSIAAKSNMVLRQQQASSTSIPSIDTQQQSQQHQQHQQQQHLSDLAVSTIRQLFPSSPQDSSLHGYIKSLLIATNISASVVILSLLYLRRFSIQSKSKSPSCVPNAIRTVFLVCLVLANKFADDERFTNRAWAGVGGLEVDALNRAEKEVLGCIDWNLSVGEGEYAQWVSLLMKLASCREANGVESIELGKKRKAQIDDEMLLAAADIKRRRSVVPHLPSPSAPITVTLPRLQPSIPSHAFLPLTPPQEPLSQQQQQHQQQQQQLAIPISYNVYPSIPINSQPYYKPHLATSAPVFPVYPHLPSQAAVAAYLITPQQQRWSAVPARQVVGMGMYPGASMILGC